VVFFAYDAVDAPAAANVLRGATSAAGNSKKNVAPCQSLPRHPITPPYESMIP
jgi:hypothetical protein